MTDAVHKADGRLFVQLMHVGRRSHLDDTAHHRQPVAPWAIAAGEQMFTPQGMQTVPEPRALTTAEVWQTIADFAHGAARAIEAGADGVEVHGANGYLVHQFLAPNANERSDEFGGSLENRARFAIEVVQAIVAAIGPDKTAIRLSPGLPTGGIVEGDANDDLYRYLAAEFDKIGIAYLHVEDRHRRRDPTFTEANPLIVMSILAHDGVPSGAYRDPNQSRLFTTIQNHRLRNMRVPLNADPQAQAVISIWSCAGLPPQLGIKEWMKQTTRQGVSRG